jgi:type II secretory pathway predicted ATPase ExeA
MLETDVPFQNPFRPGAGHMPPHLAGREAQRQEFERLLDQTVILENVVLTGLRGVGKTVLLETFKPLAITKGWLWVGTDLAETASVSELKMAIRLLADLAVVTSSLPVPRELDKRTVGFISPERTGKNLTYQTLMAIFENTPGLIEDKFKNVLDVVWMQLSKTETPRLIFAYDEAQNLADRSEDNQYALSVLLDVFQSLQRRNIPFMLVLTGLPTLFPKLVEARTFSERMFHVLTLDKLNPADSRDAIVLPIQKAACPVTFSDPFIELICDQSGGYPYFIQFICREVFDAVIQQAGRGMSAEQMTVPIDAIVQKLDSDFFAGRWSKPTDRQRDLLQVIAGLPTSEDEFTVQEVVKLAKEILQKGFSASQVNQMLVTLGDMGLIYKNRRGKYSFAVPMFSDFIRRQLERDQESSSQLFSG